MDGTVEVIQLCRLCLVKEQVEVPIFEDVGEIRQTFQKISSCLPIKITRGDNYPKKICISCSNKLDELYEFWNESVNSEKLLGKWLGPPRVLEPSNFKTQLPPIKKSEAEDETIDLESKAVFMKEENLYFDKEEIEDFVEPPNEEQCAEIEDENEEMETEDNDFMTSFWDDNSLGEPGASKVTNHHQNQNVESSTHQPGTDLSEKSKRIYETCYQRFMDWRRKNNVDSFDEDVLINYLNFMGKKLRPASVWTLYSIFKAVLMTKHQIDITGYKKLYALLKQKLEGYKAKQAKTFTPDEINRFIEEAPDERYLLEKVVLIFGIMSGCRQKELRDLRHDNVVDLHSALLVTITDSTTKKPKRFSITGRYYSICKKYMSLRPVPCQDPVFLLSFHKGKCMDQHIGKNKLGRMGKEIAGYLKLPNAHLYTGHCFRKSSAKIFIDGDGDIITPETTTRSKKRSNNKVKGYQ